MAQTYTLRVPADDKTLEQSVTVRGVKYNLYSSNPITVGGKKYVYYMRAGWDSAAVKIHGEPEIHLAAPYISIETSYRIRTLLNGAWRNEPYVDHCTDSEAFHAVIVDVRDGNDGRIRPLHEVYTYGQLRTALLNLDNRCP